MKIKAEEILKIGEKKKISQTETIYNLGGQIYIINHFGRIERIDKAKFYTFKNKILIKDRELTLIDEGINARGTAKNG